VGEQATRPSGSALPSAPPNPDLRKKSLPFEPFKLPKRETPDLLGGEDPGSGATAEGGPEENW